MSAPRPLLPFDLSEGQEVRVFTYGTRRSGVPEGGWVGRVEKVGRVLVTIDWPGRYHSKGQFRMATRVAIDDGRTSFRTVEEAEAAQREAEDYRVLREAGVSVGMGVSPEHRAELAAVVRGWVT